MQNMITVTANRENNAPAFRTENNGVEIIVTFREQAGERDVKSIVLGMLTGAYEQRIGSKENKKMAQEARYRAIFIDGQSF